MKIYLAARFTRGSELCGYRRQLEDLGHIVTSRWINGSHHPTATDVGEEGNLQERARWAREDIDDLLEADLCIHFTEPAGQGPARGGRHVEFGVCLGAGIPVMVIGHRENIFHCLPQIQFFESWADAKPFLIAAGFKVAA